MRKGRHANINGEKIIKLKISEFYQMSVQMKKKIRQTEEKRERENKRGRKGGPLEWVSNAHTITWK